MKTKIILSIVAIASCAVAQPTSLKDNGIIITKETPKSVDTISGMFGEGMWYGRMRFNSFYYTPELEEIGKNEEHTAVAIGMSLVYKTAYYNGIGMTLGLYGSQSINGIDAADVEYYKMGKDVLSRYNLASSGSHAFATIAQAYLEYKNDLFALKGGRFLSETLLTASNDTKMIPNAFEGFSLETEAIPNTQLKIEYLLRQKLRDHADFHHLLAYGDDASDKFSKWDENDDSGMHQGLTLSKLNAAGIDDTLIIFEATNTSIENLKLTANYTSVPDLVSMAILEAQYDFKVGGYKISPAFRYLQQIDDGAGAIGGANLKGKTQGYTDPTSVDSSMIAARIELSKDPYKFALGYSKISDDADLIAPWRGFPTGGYTRAMAQLNWSANTETIMASFDYDLDKAGVWSGSKLSFKYAMQDFDDNKVGVQADSDIFTTDLTTKLEKDLYLKLRLGVNVGSDDTVAGDNSIKSDPSYNEARAEVNYFF